MSSNLKEARGLSVKEIPAGISEMPADTSSLNKAKAQQTTAEHEKDFEAIGQTTLRLHAGKLTLKEPSYKKIREARIHAASWAASNAALSQADPLLNQWEFIVQLAIKSTVKWEPNGKPTQNDLALAQFEEFSANDFRIISDLVARYVGKESDPELTESA